MFICSSFISRFRSKISKSECWHISLCTVERHSCRGIEGYRFITSRVTRSTSSVIVISSKIVISSVEFFMKSGKDCAKGCKLWSMNCAEFERRDLV